MFLLTCDVMLKGGQVSLSKFILFLWVVGDVVFSIEECNVFCDIVQRMKLFCPCHFIMFMVERD